MTAIAPATPPLAPLYPGLPVLGVAIPMRLRPLAVLDDAAARFGNAFRMKLGPYHATVIREPADVKRVMVDHVANYTKQTRGYQKSRLVLGEGLVTSEGELWQRQRRIASPAMHRSKVASHAATMVEQTRLMLDRWQRSAEAAERTAPPGGARVDVFDELMRCTLEIALRTLLGAGHADQHDDLPALGRAVTILLDQTNKLITNPFSPPMWVPLPSHVRFSRALKYVDDFIYSAIHRRRAAGDTDAAFDVLSMLLAARSESGESMSDRQVRDEAVTMMIAGHETTANALTWSLYLLGTHKDILARARQAAFEAVGGRTPTFDDLPRLGYLRQVIDEAMRLYPPAWALGRCAMNDDTLSGFHVPGGSYVLVSPYLTHRHPGVWPDPLRFDPDRFSPERAGAIPKYAHIPFGAGPRFCIGAGFAATQAVLMLTTILQRCKDLAPAPGARVIPWAMITLRPRYGMPMDVTLA